MRRGLRWMSVVSWTLAAHVARAQPANVDPAGSGAAEDVTPQADDRGEALQRFNHGTALFEQGRYDAALQAFESSFSLYPTRAAIKNQALCLERLGRASDALDVLEALPQHFPSFSPEERLGYDAKLRELRARVAFIELSGIDAGWEIHIDGRVRGTTPLPSTLRVAPGAHRLELRRGTAAPIVELVNVRAGESRVLELAGALRAQSAVPRQPSTATGPAPPPAAAQMGASSRTWLGLDVAALLSPSDIADAAACDASCETRLAFGGRATLAAGYALGHAWHVTLQAGYLRLLQDVEQRDIVAQIRGVSGDVPGVANESLTLSGVVVGAGLEHRFLPWVVARIGAGAWLLGAHQRRQADIALGARGTERVEQTQRVRADFVFGSLGVLVDHGLGDAVRLGLGLDVSFAHGLRTPKWDGDEVFVSSAGFGRFRSEALARDTLLLFAPFVVARYRF